MSSTDPVVDVRGLVKTFGGTRALDGLDLSVVPGEVHGFLGPNGAGKSTTLRILLGMVRKDAGDVRLFGGDPWAEAAALHRRLAYVPGDVSLWPNLTGGEVIDLLLRMRGAPVDDPRRARDARAVRARPDQEGPRVLQGQPAEGRAGRRVRGADGPAGPRRADLGAGPADGGGLRRLRRRGPRGAGTTVLLSSHILSEVERLADRVTIIRDGRVVESGSLDEMRHLHRSRVGPTWSAPCRTSPAYPGCTT